MERRFKTLAEIFGQATLLEVLYLPPKDMLMDLPPAERDAFIEVLNNPDFTIDGLGKEDAYTKIAFEHTDDGMIKYPLTPEAEMAGVEPLVGPIGCIVSRYHMERLLTVHTGFTAGQMYETHYPIYSCGMQTKKEEEKKNAKAETEEEQKKEKQKKKTDIVIPASFVICAFFHDCGKKWVGHTNVNGEISSYGHAECSAYVANYWLRKLDFIDESMRNVIVAAIYGHDLIKRWLPQESEFRMNSYLQLIGGLTGDEGDVKFAGLFSGSENRMIKVYTETIADADAGVIDATRGSDNKEKFTITWEHFSKKDGEVKALTDQLSADEFGRITDKGYELIESVFSPRH